MKAVLSVILVVIATFLMVVNFSAVQSKYVCTGTFINSNILTDGEVFLQLEAYRPWVKLWSKSDGNLIVEAAGTTYFEHLQKAGNIYGIFSKEGGPFLGKISTLSGDFDLSDKNSINFGGRCSLL
jgi:hypothetical protein